MSAKWLSEYFCVYQKFSLRFSTGRLSSHANFEIVQILFHYFKYVLEFQLFLQKTKVPRK